MRPRLCRHPRVRTAAATAAVALLCASCAMPPSKDELEAAKNTFACRSRRSPHRDPVRRRRGPAADAGRRSGVALPDPRRLRRPLCQRRHGAARQGDGPAARPSRHGDPARGLPALPGAEVARRMGRRVARVGHRVRVRERAQDACLRPPANPHAVGIASASSAPARWAGASCRAWSAPALRRTRGTSAPRHRRWRSGTAPRRPRRPPISPANLRGRRAARGRRRADRDGPVRRGRRDRGASAAAHRRWHRRPSTPRTSRPSPRDWPRTASRCSTRRFREDRPRPPRAR